MSRKRHVPFARTLITLSALTALASLAGCKSQPSALGDASSARPAYDEPGAGPIASSPTASASQTNPYSRSPALLGDTPGTGTSSAQPRSISATRPAPRAAPSLQLGEAAPVQPVVVPAAPAAPTSPALPPAGGARTYVVQKGDTLWGIAKRSYGSGVKYREILAANPGLSPDHIRVGQTLQLP